MSARGREWMGEGVTVWAVGRPAGVPAREGGGLWIRPYGRILCQFRRPHSPISGSLNDRTKRQAWKKDGSPCSLNIL